MLAHRSMLPADLAGAVVLASVVAVDPGGWYPFVVAKFSAVALAVVAACWAASTDRTVTLPRAPFVLFASLVAVMSVAAIVGREPLYSWIGTPERHFGVATWVLGLATFAVGARLADPQRLQRFARWVTLAGLVLGAYTYIERWRPPIETSADTIRLGGTYGSASYLGAALCLILPIVVAVVASSEDRRWRAAAAVATALCTAAVIGSGTRAAWLGLLVAALVVTVGRLTRHDTECDRGVVRPKSSHLLAGGAVAIGALLASGTSASVTERSQGASSRFAEWEVGWRIVAAHPWLGVGPEGYRTALADGVTASYESTYGRSPLPDRAHNVLIDVATAGGIVASTLFVALAVLIVLGAWRRFRRGSTLEVGLAAAAIAYLVQAWFLFPVATIDPIFWLVAGALVTSPSVAPSEAHASDGAWPAPRRLVGLVGISAVVLLAVTGVFAVAADRAARQAVDAGSEAAAERAIALRPDVARYRLLAADLRRTSIDGHDAAIADIEHAEQLTPHDPIVAVALADARLRKAIATGEPDDLATALTTWHELAGADRNCYECHLGLGYAEALAGDATAARDAFERAAVLEPGNTTEARERADELETIASTSGTDRDG